MAKPDLLPRCIVASKVCDYKSLSGYLAGILVDLNLDMTRCKACEWWVPAGDRGWAVCADCQKAFCPRCVRAARGGNKLHAVQILCQDCASEEFSDDAEESPGDAEDATKD